MLTLLEELGHMGLGSRLRALSEALLDEVRRYYEAQELPFEPRWFPLIQLMRRSEALTVAAAAKQLGLSHTAVHAIVRELSEAGLVTSEAHPQDRRAKVLLFTDAGAQLVRRAEPGWLALQTALDAALADSGVLEALAAVETVLAQDGITRALEASLARDSVLERLRLVDFDPLEAAHREAFITFNREWLEHYFHVEPQDEAMFADPYATVIAPGGHIVLAQLGAHVVGAGALIRRPEGHLELARLAVARVYQGKGIGKRLTQHLLAQARSLGAARIYLVTSTLLPQAVPLYRKLGFVVSDCALHTSYARANLTMELDLDPAGG